MKIQNVENLTYITLKPIQNPKPNQVWLKCGYDKAQKKYELMNFNDINKFKYIKKDTEVYTDFTF